MIGLILRTHLGRTDQTIRLRAAAIVAMIVMSSITFGGVFALGPGAIPLITWSQLVMAIVVGGILTGWRITQLPKTRAAEFYLVTPVSDVSIIWAEWISGALRTAFIVMAGFPAVAALWGLGWISTTAGFALFVVPLAAGWMCGTLLAAIAYEPLRVRRVLSHLMIAAVIVYLILFGLLGRTFLPWALGLWSRWTNTSTDVFNSAGAVWGYLNPFRLLGAIGAGDDSAHVARIAATGALILAVTGIAFVRIVCRLRAHYLEENYGHGKTSDHRNSLIGENPLSWWIVRRVSKFKGNINLYLMWVAVALYGAWRLLGDQWPAWMSTDQVRLIQSMGGEALLAAAALQVAIVPIAFLSGMWDSSLPQRLARLELLLTTPLQSRQFLLGSLAAVWTRGQGYLLAALVMWIVAASAGDFPWPVCLALVTVAANYAFLALAMAFISFTRMAGTRSADLFGLALSVGLPFATWMAYTFVGDAWAVLSPLGAIFYLAETGQPAGAIAFDPQLRTIAAANAAYFLLACGLLIVGTKRFDADIRQWYAENTLKAARAS